MHSFRRHFICFVLLCAALEIAHRQGLNWFRWTATTVFNPGLQEGLAWRLGRLDLRYRVVDTALSPRDGRVYNCYPPLQSIIGYVTAWATWRSSEVPSKETMPAYSLMPLLIFGLPIPLTAYWVFFRRTGDPVWAAVLTASLIGGTAVIPCIVASRQNVFHHVNHLLATTGLLIMASEALGKRRVWVLLLSLAVACWSRQLSVFFALGLTSILWQGASHTNPTHRPGTTGKSKWIAWCGGLALIVGAPLGLNAAKFGSPFDSGYAYLFDQLDSKIARNFTAHGLFSPHFVPENAYYMNVALPIARNSEGEIVGKTSEYGGSLWFSTPLAFLILLGAGHWWRDRAARSLMLCSVPIIAAHLLYHNTGYVQNGYYRFALDYLPVWFVVGAPWLCTGWRRWATLICTIWSFAYFAATREWAGPFAV